MCIRDRQTGRAPGLQKPVLFIPTAGSLPEQVVLEENRGKKPAKWGLPGKLRWCILFKKFQYLSLNQPVRSPLKTTGSISEQNSKYYDTTCDKTVSQFNLHLRRIHISTDQAAPCINGRSHRVWYDGAVRAPVDTRAVCTVAIAFNELHCNGRAYPVSAPIRQ